MHGGERPGTRARAAASDPSSQVHAAPGPRLRAQAHRVTGHQHAICVVGLVEELGLLAPRLGRQRAVHHARAVLGLLWRSRVGWEAWQRGRIGSRFEAEHRRAPLGVTTLTNPSPLLMHPAPAPAQCTA